MIMLVFMLTVWIFVAVYLTVKRTALAWLHIFSITFVYFFLHGFFYRWEKITSRCHFQLREIISFEEEKVWANKSLRSAHIFWQICSCCLWDSPLPGFEGFNSSPQVTPGGKSLNCTQRGSNRLSQIWYFSLFSSWLMHSIKHPTYFP